MVNDKSTIVIGCGTGRCGTVSLSKLLDGCEDAVCTHERRPLLPWVFDEDAFQERVSYFSNAKPSLVGDVAYFYLPYMDRLIEAFPHLKIIGIERDRQAVIDSFMWWTQWRNHWVDHDGTEWVTDDVWDITHPKYELTDKAEALGAYWDEYHERMGHLRTKYPEHVRLFEMNTLNSREGQEEILDFIEVPEDRRRYPEKRRHNTSAATTRPTTKEEAVAWMHRLSLAAKDVASTIPKAATFILVDEEQLGDYVIKDRHAVPFTEREGKYWGPPSDDATAISELERLSQAGADFVVFGWPTFWWLDHYSGFHNHLQSTANCVMKNEQVIIFDLR